MLGPELDSRLIQLLTQNARLSNSELSRRLGVSRSTIQSRIERLEQTGVIQGYTLKLNPKSDKNVVQAHVSISVAPKLQAAVERLAEADLFLVRDLLDQLLAFDELGVDVAHELDDLHADLVHERLVRGGHAVALLPDLLWVEAPPAICLRELPDSGYRDIVCSVRAGTPQHPSVRAATSALHAACAEADSAITVNLATPPR